MKKLFLLLFGIGISISLSAQWTQISGDIIGEASGDFSGSVVAMNGAGDIIAVGAARNDDGGADAGHVRVYRYQSGAYVQMGADIDGTAADDYFGFSLDISNDGMRMVVGAPYNSDAGTDAGQVSVFEYSGGSWVQLGSDIDGATSSERFGSAVAISGDGTRIVVGAPYNSVSAYNVGVVRVYEYSGGSWTQIGADIIGKETPVRAGASVDISDDGSIIAIGAPSNLFDDNPYVAAYQFSGSSWTQMGSDIAYVGISTLWGYSVSLSADGSRMALGSPFWYSDLGLVRVYDFAGGAWNQVGADIWNITDHEGVGQQVKLSASGDRIAVSTTNTGPFESSIVLVYGDAGGSWMQLGDALMPDSADTRFGYGLAISDDGNTIAIGESKSTTGPNNAGVTRVYGGGSVAIETVPESWGSISIYPQPATNVLQIEIASETPKDISLNLYQANGQLVHAENFDKGDIVSKVSIPVDYLAAGMYWLQLSDGEKSFGQAIVIE